MSLVKFRNDFLETLLAFIWRQWAQMGLSAHVSKNDLWSVDPEALVLFSIEIARYEARMFDEILDWLVVNSHLISTQRLKNLLKRDNSYPTGLIAAVSETVNSSSRKRGWSITAEKKAKKCKREPLFFRKKEEPVSSITNVDPIFAGYGYLRSIFVPSGKSLSPLTRKSFNLAFRLRKLFGLGSRAEIIRYLILQRGADVNVASIADAAGFAKRNINEALNDLAVAGTIQARSRGNEKLYTLQLEPWTQLLGIRPSEIPIWINWPYLFRALSVVFRWLNDPRNLNLSDYMQSSETRRVMQNIRQDLEAAGFRTTDDKMYLGETYTPVFISDMKNVLQRLK